MKGLMIVMVLVIYIGVMVGNLWLGLVYGYDCFVVVVVGYGLFFDELFFCVVEWFDIGVVEFLLFVVFFVYGYFMF